MKNTLEDAIESLITQNFGFEHNIELIIVDDGSSDDSLKNSRRNIRKNIRIIFKFCLKKMAVRPVHVIWDWNMLKETT